METIIKVSPSELDINLLEKIKTIIGDNNNVDVTISLNEYNPNYVDELNASIHQAENKKNITTFTLQEFMEYSPNE